MFVKIKTTTYQDINIFMKQTTTSLLNSLNLKKRPRHMMLEIKVLARDRQKNVTGLNQLMGSQPSSLYNWNSNIYTYINKQ
jgi:hypothetical protein